VAARAHAHPQDAAALAALAELLRRPGDEGRRADTLSGRRHPRAAPGAVWLEAASLRWRMLGDARTALPTPRRRSRSHRVRRRNDLRSGAVRALD
jgi:hypothetical protein